MPDTLPVANFIKMLQVAFSSTEWQVWQILGLPGAVLCVLVNKVAPLLIL